MSDELDDIRKGAARENLQRMGISERSQTPPTSNNRNQPDWCSERYGFVTVPKDGSRDFRKLSDGPWCSWVEAQTKIEQLTRERDEARATVQLTETITARMERLARGRIEAERDRLRALVQRAHTIIAIREVAHETHKDKAWLEQATRELNGEPSPAPETRGGWRPIETVPRDVKVLTLRWSMGDKRSLIDTATLERHGQVTGLHHGNGVFFCKVTHWMPLPEPPLKASGEPTDAEKRAMGVDLDSRDHEAR